MEHRAHGWRVERLDRMVVRLEALTKQRDASNEMVRTRKPFSKRVASSSKLLPKPEH